MKLQPIHLRVNDAETGQPTPCRIRISDPSGNDYAPFGRTLNFATGRGEDVGGQFRIGREHWYSIDGACEIAVPPGELLVQVRKGLAYTPLDQIVNLPAGKMALRMEIERQKLPFMNAIDMRCHFASPHDVALDAAAEGITIANLLIEPRPFLANDGLTNESAANLAAFSGKSACLDRSGSAVFVNTHNRHPVLGSLGLLHSHRPVFPLSFGGPDTTDDWSLDDWADQCHRKRGFVVWTEPFAANRQHAGEALALAILGKIDAYELSPDTLIPSLKGWYHLLSAGINLPVVGASRRDRNDRPIGALQTVTAGSLTEWVDILRYGGGTATNGPSVNVVMDHETAHAAAMSVVPFKHLELIENGKVVCRVDAKPIGAKLVDYLAQLEHHVTSPAWIAARVLDTEKSLIDSRFSIFAHSCAKVVGEPRRNPAAVAFLQGHLDRCRDWVENVGRFEQPKSKKHLLDTLAAATDKLNHP